MFTLLNCALHITLQLCCPTLLNCALHPTLAAPLRYTPKLCSAPYTSSLAALHSYTVLRTLH